jgi:hypothetical protein
MKVACRFPGGMTIAVTRSHGDPLTVHLNGPSGTPSVLPPPTSIKNLPSHYVATALHKKVVDTVKRLQDTSANEFSASDYGVTEVSGSFWNTYLAQNLEFDVIKHKMVFPL